MAFCYPPKVQLAFFNFADRIAGRLDVDSQTFFALVGTSASSLVNPLLYPNFQFPPLRITPSFRLLFTNISG